MGFQMFVGVAFCRPALDRFSLLACALILIVFPYCGTPAGGAFFLLRQKEPKMRLKKNQGFSEESFPLTFLSCKQQLVIFRLARRNGTLAEVPCFWLSRRNKTSLAQPSLRRASRKLGSLGLFCLLSLARQKSRSPSAKRSAEPFCIKERTLMATQKTQ